jgi:hypothetical protein
MKKTYIERSGLLSALVEADSLPWTTMDDAYAIIFNAPISDVVEVIRCKDCAVPHNKWTGCPNLKGLVTPPDFYCALAEPKIKR